MRYRMDGSVQSAMVPTADRGRREDHAMYRCLVTRVVYTDDPNNITASATNPRVLYDVVVIGGFAAGQVISNCRLASDSGGNDAYHERILRAATKDVSTNKLSDSDGDIVFVKFNQGHTGAPYIIALDNGINTQGSIGAKKSDGPRDVQQYNGVKKTIDNTGNWKVEIFGGTATPDKGNFKPGSAAQMSLQLTKDQKMSIASQSGVSIEIDGKSNTATIKKGSTQIVLDGNADKVSLKSGFVDLGASVSDFAVLFTELLSAFNSHTHPFIDITPGGPVNSTTMPPTAPMLQSVGSQTVKVQP